MKSTPEEEKLAKRLAVVERDCARLREGPGPDSGLLGCGAHSCLVAPAEGMGTNSRCRCDEATLRRMIRWQAREIAKLRAQLHNRDVADRYDSPSPGAPFGGSR